MPEPPELLMPEGHADHPHPLTFHKINSEIGHIHIFVISFLLLQTEADYEAYYVSNI